MSAITAGPRPAAGPGRSRPGRLPRLLRGPAADPRWARPALLGLLAATALLYAAGLSRNGWANDFYSAAVQAGTRSWKAFFFGSFDASSFITVDKTPASLWVMELSARVFGLNSWSVLLPQAAEGVASVAVLYAAVRRWSGPAAGLIAAGVLAITPVATLMFRFNNPDALLVLLMTVAAYAMVRATESGRTRWIVLAGALLGFGFLTKMLQAFLVLPAFALVYLVAGPPRLGRRIWQLLAGGAALVLAAGWWVAVVQFTPAAGRPYVGGSTNDSVLQLALGYNGLGRLDGNETGSVGFNGGGGGGGGGGAFGGSAGLSRLFASEMGGQISWLLPAALIALAALVWLSWRRAADRPGPGRGAAVGRLADRHRAGLQLHERHHPPVLHGGPGPGDRRAGRHRRGHRVARPAQHGHRAAARRPRRAGRGPDRDRVLGVRAARPVGRLAALAAAPGAGLRAGRGSRGDRRALAARPGRAAVRGAAGPGGQPGRAARLQPRHGRHLAHRRAAQRRAVRRVLRRPGRGSRRRVRRRAPGRRPRRPGRHHAGRPGCGRVGCGRVGSGRDRAPGGSAAVRGSTSGRPSGTGTGRSGQFPRGGQGGGIGGGLGGSTQVSSALTKLLASGASGYRWAAATVGAESAAPFQLASGEPIMAIGGFNGTDQAPSLAEFEKMVAAHEVHYFIGTNGHTFGGGSWDATQITSWVQAHFTRQTVGGVTVYNLTRPASS